MCKKARQPEKVEQSVGSSTNFLPVVQNFAFRTALRNWHFPPHKHKQAAPGLRRSK
jgi:hypothetical protein